MASSINQLALDLCDDVKLIMRKYYDDIDKFKLMTRKGIFPYEYVDSWAKLDETELPERKDCFSKLNNAGISKQNYDHANHV